MLIMREVLTVIGPTADPENRSASLPYAVREWCINTAAVNPATHSVFVPSEDGRIYRWDLVSNSLTQFLQLNPGIGEPSFPASLVRMGLCLRSTAAPSRLWATSTAWALR